MRQERTHCPEQYIRYADHEIGHELCAMSGWPDEHPDMLDWIAPALCQAGVKAIWLWREGVSRVGIT